MSPRPEVTKHVRNQSSRNGVKPSLVVLHSTEGHNRPGLSDLQGLGDYFDRYGVDASSHVANDAEGNDARYVPDERKAWTQAQFNPVALSIEQIGFASQSSWPAKQVRNTAEWIAYWSKKHGIPIRRGKVMGNRVIQSGVVMHSELGAPGGGHHDPGRNFPLDRCLEIAREIAGDLDPRKEKAWERSLRIQRAKLKGLLNLRAKLRQEKLENTARYAWTTRKMNATKTRIRKLTRLLRR
jgi:N-acetyl-anhydromuramyl-L-alanine amidase AmpD